MIVITPPYDAYFLLLHRRHVHVFTVLINFISVPLEGVLEGLLEYIILGISFQPP